MSATALVLFAHGARDPEWAEPFRKIKRLIALGDELSLGGRKLRQRSINVVELRCGGDDVSMLVSDRLLRSIQSEKPLEVAIPNAFGEG